MSTAREGGYAFDSFRLSPDDHLLWRDGEPVPLTPKSFELLLVLVRHSNRVLITHELMNAVWPDTFVEEGNLKVTVHMLRKALGNQPSGRPYIETVPRLGYRFAAPVATIPADDLPEGMTLGAPADDVQGDAHRALLGRRWPRKWRPYLAVAAGLAMITAFASSWFLVRHRATPQRSVNAAQPISSPIRSLAVLPLRNLSGNSEQDYFADGVTDALITGLAQVRGLRVVSETSAMRFKGSRASLADIARQLNVDAVVEGAVLRAGDEVRVTAQLIDARADRHLWAGAYERKATDVLALQDDVARSIVGAIRPDLTTPEAPQTAFSQPVDVAAYDAYLEGRYFSNRRTPESLGQAVDYFKTAVREDPRYAPAWAGMADAYALLGLYNRPATVAMPQARAAAEKALDLDPSFAGAHTALGAVKALYEWDWTGAEREFQRALEISPGDAHAHHWYAVLCLAPQGRYNQAIAEMQRAEELDPVSLIINTDLGWTYFIAGRYDLALAQYRKTLILDPNYLPIHFRLVEYYSERGLYPQALEEMGKDGGVFAGLIPVSTANNTHAEEDYRAVIRNKLNQLEGGSRSDPWLQARLAVQLGNRARALSALETAYRQRDPALVYLSIDPEFAGMHSDRGFQALLKGVRLPAPDTSCRRTPCQKPS